MLSSGHLVYSSLGAEASNIAGTIPSASVKLPRRQIKAARFFTLTMYHSPNCSGAFRASAAAALLSRPLDSLGPSEHVTNILASDLMLLLPSILFIVVYLVFQLRSWW